MQNHLENMGYFFEHTKTARHTLFYVNAIGIIADNPTFNIPNRKYFDYLVMYLIDGIMTISQNDKTIVLKPNDFVFMDLNLSHSYFSDKNNACKVIWIHFGGKDIQSLLKTYISSDFSFPYIERDEKILNIIDESLTFVKKNEANLHFKLSSKTYSLVIRLIELFKENGFENQSSDDFKFINQVDKYIEAHMNEKIVLLELSKTLCMSQYHFSRKFKRATSFSPMNYVLIKKIKHAKFSIDYTDKSFSTISRELAFSDQSHFTRSFKRIEGQSPSDFKNRFHKK